MRWSDRYNWFAAGFLTASLIALNIFGFQDPLALYLFMEQSEDLQFAWIVLCVTFAVVWKLYRQLWLDRRPRKGYKEGDQP